MNPGGIQNPSMPWDSNWGAAVHSPLSGSAPRESNILDIQSSSGRQTPNTPDLPHHRIRREEPGAAPGGNVLRREILFLRALIHRILQMLLR